MDKDIIEVEAQLAANFHNDTADHYKPSDIVKLVRKNREFRVLIFAIMSAAGDALLTAAYIANFFSQGRSIKEFDKLRKD